MSSSPRNIKPKRATRGRSPSGALTSSSCPRRPDHRNLKALRTSPKPGRKQPGAFATVDDAEVADDLSPYLQTLTGSPVTFSLGASTTEKYAQDNGGLDPPVHSALDNIISPYLQTLSGSPVNFYVAENGTDDDVASLRGLDPSSSEDSSIEDEDSWFKVDTPSSAEFDDDSRRMTCQIKSTLLQTLISSVFAPRRNSLKISGTNQIGVAQSPPVSAGGGIVLSPQTLGTPPMTPRDSKDWNRELRLCNGDEEATMRVHLAFQETARAFARIIISEVGLSNGFKTMKESQLGGVAGGSKYICSAAGMLFKFAQDVKMGTGQYLYGRDTKRTDLANKAAWREITGAHAWGAGNSTTGAQSMNFPLMACIDFAGYRVLAVSVLPITADSLKYGSPDGKIVRHDEKVHRLQKKTARSLNLAGHFVGPEFFLEGPGDAEVHLLDSKYYALDLARVQCPEAPINGGKRSVFSYMLRPELTLRWPRPLCQDAFTGFLSVSDPKRLTHMRELAKCTRHLHSEVIPHGARVFDHLCLDRKSIAQVGIELHNLGINYRYAMEVANLCVTKSARTLLLDFCVVRTMKNLLREELRSCVLSCKVPAEEPLRETLASFFNRMLGLAWRSGKDPMKKTAWPRNWYARVVKNKLMEWFRSDYDLTDVSLFDTCRPHTLAGPVGDLVGAQIVPFVQRRLDSRGRFGYVMSSADITIIPVVRGAPVVVAWKAKASRKLALDLPLDDDFAISLLERGQKQALQYIQLNPLEPDAHIELADLGVLLSQRAPSLAYEQLSNSRTLYARASAILHQRKLKNRSLHRLAHNTRVCLQFLLHVASKRHKYAVARAVAMELDAIRDQEEDGKSASDRDPLCIHIDTEALSVVTKQSQCIVDGQTLPVLLLLYGDLKVGSTVVSEVKPVGTSAIRFGDTQAVFASEAERDDLVDAWRRIR